MYYEFLQKKVVSFCGIFCAHVVGKFFELVLCMMGHMEHCFGYAADLMTSNITNIKSDMTSIYPAAFCNTTCAEGELFAFLVCFFILFFFFCILFNMNTLVEQWRGGGGYT